MSNTRKIRVQHCGGFSRPRELWAGKRRFTGVMDGATRLNNQTRQVLGGFGALVRMHGNQGSGSASRRSS